MDERFSMKLRGLAKEYKDEVLTDDLFQRIEKRVYAIVSTFEEEYKVRIEGIKLNKQLDGKVSITWSSIQC